MLEIRVNLFLSRFAFRTSVKGPLSKSQIANQRTDPIMDTSRHLPTREVMTMERSSKNNSAREKVGWGN